MLTKWSTKYHGSKDHHVRIILCIYNMLISPKLTKISWFEVQTFFETKKRAFLKQDYVHFHQRVFGINSRSCSAWNSLYFLFSNLFMIKNAKNQFFTFWVGNRLLCDMRYVVFEQLYVTLMYFLVIGLFFSFVIYWLNQKSS